MQGGRRAADPERPDEGTSLAMTADDNQPRRNDREVIMKRYVAAGLSILAVATGVGWKLARHPETSAGLQEVSLRRHSEHSHPGPTNALAGIRIRLSASDFGYEIRATDQKVPQISMAAE